MITLYWTRYNSCEEQYKEKWHIKATTKEELEEALEKIETSLECKELTIEEVDKPKNFGCAGGFASDFNGAFTEDGEDVSSWLKDWYGEPKY